MAMESAKSFVEKFFGDDEFIKEFYKKGGFIAGKNVDEETQNRKTVEVANEFGYDFSAEEYKAANKEYAKSIGTWKTIKRFLHLAKVVKAAEKRRKKRNSK